MHQFLITSERPNREPQYYVATIADQIGDIVQSIINDINDESDAVESHADTNVELTKLTIKNIIIQNDDVANQNQQPFTEEEKEEDDIIEDSNTNNYNDKFDNDPVIYDHTDPVNNPNDELINTIPPMSIDLKHTIPQTPSVGEDDDEKQFIEPSNNNRQSTPLINEEDEDDEEFID